MPLPSPCRTRWLVLPIAFGLAAAGLLLGATHSARADMAPFPAQAGTSLGAASATNIRLISETVLIAVTDVVITNDSGYPAYTQTAAKVTADFALLNPDSGPQALQVGFPMQVPQQAAPPVEYVKITHLAAFVGGVAVTTNAATVGPEIWSAWSMTFASGTTHVRVTYDLPATNDSCNSELGYVLHTGAAWAGSIGQADLIVRYPYAAEATFVSPHGLYLGNSTPGYQVEGNDLHWHYDNLEPTPANDLALTFVAPECWRPVAAARAALKQHATAENYWHLASAYAMIVFPHHGFYSPLIAQIADVQYQKALALDPQNPQINAEYAEFLLEQVGVGQLLPITHQPDQIQQCAKALVLAPTDDNLMAMCGYYLSSQIGDPNVSEAAQATAAAVLTVAPLPTFPPSATPLAPAVTSTAVARPSPLPSASATTPLSATPPPSPTASPQPAATVTPVAVAQITAAVATVTATPTPPPASALSTALPLLGLFLLVVMVVGVYYWRRRAANHPNP